MDNYKKSFEKGRIVFEEGSVGKELYILLKGKLAVVKDGKEIAVIDTPNSFVGELAALLELNRTATVKAIEDSVLFVIPPENFKRVISLQPDIAIKLIKLLAERLKTTTDSLAEVLGKYDVKYSKKKAKRIEITPEILFRKAGLEHSIKILNILGTQFILNRFSQSFSKAQKEIAIFNKRVDSLRLAKSEDVFKALLKLLEEYQMKEKSFEELKRKFEFFFADCEKEMQFRD